MNTIRKRYIGDKAFYKMALTIALPILIQNAITNFVGMLDNIMVGQVGTVQMNGVAIVNQLMFVFNLCIFGAASGAGIFTAQFSGQNDHKGIRDTFRFKILCSIALSAVAVGIFLLWGQPLIKMYLTGEGSPEDAAATLAYGKDYLKVMLWGLLPFAIANAYSATLRETGQTVVSMVAGITAVAVNLVFNYILIFGHFGAPAMGVQGAAIATVISRFVELGVLAVWTHTHTERNPFIVGAFRSMRIPMALTRKIIVKGMPLLVNEFLWSFGMAFLNRCYSVRGLHVIGACNISATLWNVFSVSFLAMGNAVGIIIGKMLGAEESEEKVRDTDRKLIAFSVSTCVIFSILYVVAGQFFPDIYNTTEEIRALSRQFIVIGAVLMPFSAYANAAYFTLRSGGKTLVTFLFDSCFIWVINVPLVYILARFTSLPIVPLYFVSQGMEAVKCILGAVMIRKGSWIQNITAGTEK